MIDYLYYLRDKNGNASGVYRKSLVVATHEGLLKLPHMPKSAAEITSQSTHDSLPWLMWLQEQGIYNLSVITGYNKKIDSFYSFVLSIEQLAEIATRNNSVLAHALEEVASRLRTMPDAPKRHEGNQR